MTGPDKIAHALLDGLRPLAGLPVLDGPGLYIFALGPGARLTGITPAERGLLYLGMTAQSLSLRNHFLHPDSGRSTLRRSLGALLADPLQLIAVPRGRGASERDIANFRFGNDGEARLTAWMGAQLLACQIALNDGVRELEKQLIQSMKPPLNLTDWPNPQRAIIDSARRKCRERARAALAAR